MLKSELYEIINLTKDEAEVKLLKSSVVYAAHFPGHPITPGVVIVKIAVELMSEICGHAVEVISARNIKFISPVIPSDDTRLVYQFGDSGSVSVLMNGNVCASMTLKLQ